MERRLRERIRVLAGQQVAVELDLKQMLDRYGERLLGKQSASAAHFVRLTANQVLHEKAVGSEKALAVLEAARTVILELK
jgi:hypothetical protein